MQNPPQMKKGYLLLLLAVSFVSACNMAGKIDAEENFDYGQTQQNVYFNRYFDFKMPIPAEWIQLNREELYAFDNEDEPGYNPAKMETTTKAKDVETVTILSLNKYPEDSIVDFNPSLMIVVENVSANFMIKDGKDYVGALVKALKDTDLDYQFDENSTPKTIGGKEFYILNTSVDNQLMDQPITQLYYSTVIKGFALVGILTYTGESDGTELAQVMEGMVFKKE